MTFWGINSLVTGLGLILWLMKPEEEKFNFLLGFLAFAISVITFITLTYAKSSKDL